MVGVRVEVRSKPPGYEWTSLQCPSKYKNIWVCVCVLIILHSQCSSNFTVPVHSWKHITPFYFEKPSTQRLGFWMCSNEYKTKGTRMHLLCWSQHKWLGTASFTTRLFYTNFVPIHATMVMLKFVWAICSSRNTFLIPIHRSIFNNSMLCYRGIFLLWTLSSFLYIGIWITFLMLKTRRSWKQCLYKIST